MTKELRKCDLCGECRAVFSSKNHKIRIYEECFYETSPRRFEE